MQIFKEMLIPIIHKAEYNRPSIARTITNIIRANELQDAIAESIIRRVAMGVKSGVGLSSVANGIGRLILQITEYESDTTTITPGKVCKLGLNAIDWCYKAGLIDIEKFTMVENNNKFKWFLKVVDDDFREFIEANFVRDYRYDLGITPWTRSTMIYSGINHTIVKEAKKYQMLDYFSYENMPMVYRALNKLNATTWVINKDMLERLNGANNILIPGVVSKIDRKKAISVIKNMDRISLWLSEIRFKQLVEKGFNKKNAKRLADNSAEEFKKIKQFDHLDVISRFSKREEFDACIDVALDNIDNNINYLYQCDSRGRIYSVQPFLNPQASDVAKSLLQFKNGKPVSTYDLMISIANHAGQDKVAYDDRIKWVNDNQDMIYLVGTDTWNEEALKWLKDTGIYREAKTKFQFIASCIEYAKLLDWIEAGNNQDDFISHISVGYDATNSGLQVLSALGRDDQVAPLVNISNTEKPGDVYQYIGDFVAKTHTIDSLKKFKPGKKIWRKICKRNVMTKPYSATLRGMGDQHWEDRKTYGTDETDNLTLVECRSLGQTIYNICKTKLPKASALMDTFQKAVSHNNEALVTWTLPSGFTAFQHKCVLKDADVSATICDKNIKVDIFIVTDKPNKSKHSFAIAPNIVHSIDAWLLMGIVNDMPDDANLHFIHDQFGSDSCYGEDIMNYAKSNYYTISSRTVLTDILFQVAQRDVELPEAGSWEPEELLEAKYVVC